MASVLLLLVATTLAAIAGASANYAPAVPEPQQPNAQPPYTKPGPPSSCSQTQLDDILYRCRGANGALFTARDKCCNEMGKKSQCSCLALTSVLHSVRLLPPLCDNYDACSGVWNNDDEADQQQQGVSLLNLLSVEYGCSLLDWGEYDAVKQCKPVVEEVLKLQEGFCLKGLHDLKALSGSCFIEALVKLRIEKYVGVIEKLLQGCH
ncbi:hypothetical protein ACP4OV_020372 [Aristida adscensionis]